MRQAIHLAVVSIFSIFLTSFTLYCVLVSAKQLDIFSLNWINFYVPENLCKIDIRSVTKRNNVIKCTDFKHPAVFKYHSSKER